MFFLIPTVSTTVYQVNRGVLGDTQKNSMIEMREYGFYFENPTDAYSHVLHDVEARYQNKIAEAYSKVKAAPKIKINSIQAPRFLIH